MLMVAVGVGMRGRESGAQVPLFVRLSNAQHAPSLHWWVLNTAHFQVIYPDSMAATAQRAAKLLERAYTPLGRTLEQSPERIPVVLGNQSAISNAFVAWAPRRSEWHAIPPGNVDEFGPIDWLSLLAVHEGRHMVQERAIRSGIVGLLDKVFGDETTAFVGGALYFPSWFWEGDAVGTETALTSQGRGRQPAFANRVRAMRLDGQPYPYYRAWNGSYRTFYPDWYQLGYLLTTHVKRAYGDSAWAKAITSASRWPIPPWALSHGLKKVTGRSLTQIHRDAIHELDTLWRAQVKGLDTTTVTLVTPRKADYHVWRLPQDAGDGSILAEYWDMSTVTSLVRLRGGRQEVVIPQFGTRGDQQFHVAGGRVVWTEYEFDSRFVQRSYLTLRVMDLATGVVRRVSHETRYLTAALSPDGARIAAVRFTEGGSTLVDVLDASTGTRIATLPNPEDHSLVTPVWSASGEALFVVVVDRHSGRGNALVRVDLERQSADTVLGFREAAIAHPVVHDHWVLYGSPATGIENIEALDLTTGRRYAVTQRRYGARNPAVSTDGTRILFQDYSPDGWEVVEVPFHPAEWRPIADVPTRSIAYYAPLLQQEDVAAAEAPLPNGDRWHPRRYRGVRTLLDFHSLSLSPTGDAHNQGLVLQSTNVLSTFATSIGGIFNTTERTASFELGVSYAAQWPIFDGALRYGQRASVASLDSGSITYSWRERSAQAGLRLPLVRVRGLTTQRVLLSTSAGLTRVEGRTVESRFSNNNGDFVPLTYALSASQFNAGAVRDIMPRGISATMVYRHTPLDGDYQGHQLFVAGSLRLPGLFPNHGLLLEGEREEQRRVNYLFPALSAVSRGYDALTAERIGRVGATYELPLWYPDVALGPLAYFRRVQGGVYFDYGYAARRDNSVRILMRSFGGEVTTDVSPIQLRSSMRLGIRVNYRVDERPHVRNNVLISLPF